MPLLEARYRAGDFNEARKRMARIPDGGTLIKNSVSMAPGFQIGNVFVMAGVPMVMRAMMEEIATGLPRGVPVTVVTVSRASCRKAPSPQGWQRCRRPIRDIAIGSYPFIDEQGAGAQLVARGRDADAVEAGGARRSKRCCSAIGRARSRARLSYCSFNSLASASSAASTSPCRGKRLARGGQRVLAPSPRSPSTV